MRRREFILALGGAAAASSYLWPLGARAQQREQMKRVGILLAAYRENDPAAQARIAAFRSTLQALGWGDERTLRLDFRWGEGNAERGKALDAELVQTSPDAIVVAGDPAVVELRRLATAIPIVFTQASDPVDSGFVASLARPGGSITGFQNFEPEMGGKWLGLLKEIAPTLRNVGVLVNPGTAPHAVFLRAAEVVAPSLGVTLSVATIRNGTEVENAVAAVAGPPDSGLIIFPHPITIANRGLIHSLAASRHLPAIYPYRYFATDGGLISYGPDQIDQWRGAAGYVDRILKGEKPADLPVQAPTKYELIINLKTAKALGLEIPPMLLGRADEVIE